MTSLPSIKEDVTFIIKEKKPHGNKGRSHPGWNKGLTKETSSIIAEQSKKNIGRSPPNKGKGKYTFSYLNITNPKEYDRQRHLFNKEHMKKIREERHLEIKEYRLKNLYGISLEEFRDMEIQSNGRCAICGNNYTAKGPIIDHNHETGKIRGLLCVKCNVMLGLVGENIETLKKAIDYLNKNH